jgi:predicted transcriptional regulator
MQQDDTTVLSIMKQSPDPLKAGEIAEMAGLEKEIVTKSINRLKKDGLIISPKRCYYAVKE